MSFGQAHLALGLPIVSSDPFSIAKYLYYFDQAIDELRNPGLPFQSLVGVVAFSRHPRQGLADVEEVCRLGR